MRLKTILNHGLNFKCFCIGKSEFNDKKDSIIVEIKARTNSKPVLQYLRNTIVWL